MNLYNEVSYKCSKLVTNSYSTSFSLGVSLLHKDFVLPIHAIYGFVRFADEIVDSFHTNDKRTLLDRFTKDTHDAIRDKISLNPILQSFQDTVNKYNIDIELINTFLRSMEMDLDKNAYNQAGYEEYILGSAEVVGLMCLKIFVEGDEKEYQRLKHDAMKLGSAFQKINFLRDLKADVHTLGRAYFPGFDPNNFNAVTKKADVIIASADYHHVEQKLLEEKYRNYSESYWKSRKMAPSCLMYYLGIDKKIEGLEHHNLFFDTPFDLHAEEIYDRPQWPTQPLFYSTCASKTDNTVAPEGKENLVLLIPIAVDIEDTEAIREKYFNIMVDRLEHLTGQSIKQHVIVKKSYAINDFKADYNSFGGNAYGLANILKQTAILKPSLKNKKVQNLYYAGQLTVPGPGVPPSIISGQVAAREVIKLLGD